MPLLGSLGGRQVSSFASEVPGLAVKFFAGDWRTIVSTGDIGTLPLDFASTSFALPSPSVYTTGSAVISGATPLSYGNIGDYYGMLAIGYFTAPSTGTYTFYTNSTDGSGVWIGSATASAEYGRTTANAVVNNGLGTTQSLTKRSGTVTLTAGVKYPIRIVHESRKVTDSFTFSWKTPTGTETTSLATYFTTRKVGPNSYGFYTPIKVGGLAGKFFAGSYRSTIATGTIGTIPLTSEVKFSTNGVTLYSNTLNYTNAGDSYGFIATGYFLPPITGTYTFYTNSTNGSGVWVGNVAVVASGRIPTNAVVNNALGSAQTLTKRSGTVSLTAGVEVAVRIVHEESSGSDSFAFSWSGPSIPETTALGPYFTVYKFGPSYGYFTDAPFTAPSQLVYTTPGTYTWTAPTGVYTVSAVCVGGGGGGISTGSGGGGGGGGGLGWKLVPVTPGVAYTVSVGAAGSGTASTSATTGGSSYFGSLATVSGSGGSGASTVTGGAGGGYVGDGGGFGGSGGTGNSSYGGGGGGAGGYAGNGGAGGSSGGSASSGLGGGGGGGGYSSSAPNGAGGGVGILGQGTNGAAASSNGDAGQGGSGGLPSTNTVGQSVGGSYGGGGSGGDDSSLPGGNGGSGAVRLIWGAGRAYPSTSTADV